MFSDIELWEQMENVAATKMCTTCEHFRYRNIKCLKHLIKWSMHYVAGCYDWCHANSYVKSSHFSSMWLLKVFQ